MQAEPLVTNRNELTALPFLADVKGAGASSAPVPVMPDFLALLKDASGGEAPPEPHPAEKHAPNSGFYVFLQQTFPLNAPLTLQFDLSRQENRSADAPAQPVLAADQPVPAVPVTPTPSLPGPANYFAFAAHVTSAAHEMPPNTGTAPRPIPFQAGDLSRQEPASGTVADNPVLPQDPKAIAPDALPQAEQKRAADPVLPAKPEHDSSMPTPHPQLKTEQHSEAAGPPQPAQHRQDTNPGPNPAPQRRVNAERVTAERAAAEHIEKREIKIGGGSGGAAQQHQQPGFSFREHASEHIPGVTLAQSKAASSLDIPGLHPAEVLGQTAAPTPTNLAAKSISLELGADAANRVVLRIAERGDGIAVAVRSTAPELSQALRDNVQDLVRNLERKGMDAEIWTPRAGASSGSTFQENSAGQRPQHFDKGDPRGGEGQGEYPEQRDRKRQSPRWLEELEEAAPGISSTRSKP